MEVPKALTSLGAVAGLYYGVTKNKGFWGTAGFTLLFAIGGAALGNFYDAVKK
jgi:lipoprotein signal peptidase